MEFGEHFTKVVSISIWRRIVRLMIAGAIIAIIVSICLFIHPLHPATVALLMLLAILIAASRWGSLEAVAMAVVGTLAFAYYFLPPFGWSVAGVEHKVALVTFTAVALATGNVAARARNQTIRERQGRLEAEQLYVFMRDLTTFDRVDSLLVLIPNLMVRVFALDGVAFHNFASQQFVRAGPKSHRISNEQLRSAASGLIVEAQGFLVTISLTGAPIGSLWLSGNLSGHFVKSIIERLEIRLERIAAEEKRNEAEAIRKSQELGSAVLDALIHQIKTPLSVVKTATTTLLSSDSDGVGREEMLTLVSEEIDHLDMIVNEVLWTSHVKSGVLQPQVRSYNLRQLVESSLAELKSRTNSRPVQIEIPNTLPMADFDFQMAKVVLKELVNNALKFSAEDSPVAISVRQMQSEIVTSVRDWGIGIAEGEESRVFEKYYRGKVVSAGTGLGLAFAKTLVEAHGGRIGATRAPDCGTVFYFSLPVSQGGAA